MPGVGPTLIFDKSALQSLSAREALWLDCFYNTNITPLFYVETLADLYKEMSRGRTPEQMVGDIASKTPEIASGVNADHHTLCVNDLLGCPVPMNRLPVTMRGRSVLTGDRLGIVVERPAEMEAFERWQQGDYLTVERQFARSWRASLANLDFNTMLRNAGLPRGARLNAKDLAEAKGWADRLVCGERNRFSTLRGALQTLSIPEELWSRIIQRWKLTGGASLIDFAPYVAHVFNVEIFFFISLAAGLISADKPNNQIDLAYLYYLPFCMVFVSGDKLHRRTAPLFIRHDQAFIWAPDLKADLARIDAELSRLPEPVKERGVFAYTQYPLLGNDSITTQLWDRFLPAWREISEKRSKRSNERDADLIGMLEEMDSAPETSEPVTSQAAQFMVIRRQMRTSRAGLRIVPHEVEDTPV